MRGLRDDKIQACRTEAVDQPVSQSGYLSKNSSEIKGWQITGVSKNKLSNQSVLTLVRDRREN